METLKTKHTTTKTKGCKKCGRNAKKQARYGSPISLFVRNKIDAKQYFALVGLSVKG